MFLEGNDIPQVCYEKERKFALGKPYSRPSIVQKSLLKNGVAGLFINLESSLTSMPPRASRRWGTALYHTRLPEENFESIALSLAECVGVSSTSRIQQVKKKTVLLALTKAGVHAKKVSHFFLRNMRCSECQLDEMWSFIGKKEKNLNAAEKLQGVLGDAWIWIAFDAVTKVVLAYVIGKRTLPHAVCLLEEVKRVTADTPELFSSDQLDHYANALLQVYGNMVIPRRKPGAGRPPIPRLVPPRNLNYVHVVKEYKKNRIHKISHKIIYGDAEKISEILENSIVSKTINTSYVERNNGTIRHIDARCSRKTYRFSKIKENHEHQLSLSLAYYHLCRPHRMLTKRYNKPSTPFMAAGLTDHIWSMEELLRFKPENHSR
jgi:IS1 family transposase